jgi:DNA-binding response OmpR family regulator
MTLKDNILILEDDLKPSKIFTTLSAYFSTHRYTFQKSNCSLILNKIRTNLIVINTCSMENNNFYCLSWLKNYYPHIPIIVLFEKASCEERVQILELGIQSYILKPFLDQELLMVIQKLLGVFQAQHKCRTINIGNLVFDIVTNSVVKNKEKAIHLTTLEADILKLLCLNAGSIVSRDDIMLQTKGVKHNPLDRSIDIHINNLRKKIETYPSKPEYIHTVRGKGYRIQSLRNPNFSNFNSTRCAQASGLTSVVSNRSSGCSGIS